MKYYSQTHEWHERDGDIVTIGISRFALEELTDITYLDFIVSVGEDVVNHQSFGEIESVKATNELYSSVNGTVVEVNEEVLKDPDLMNKNGHEVWLIKVKSNDDLAKSLLKEDQYNEQFG